MAKRLAPTQRYVLRRMVNHGYRLTGTISCYRFWDDAAKKRLANPIRYVTVDALVERGYLQEDADRNLSVTEAGKAALSL